MIPSHWLDRPYYSLDAYCKNRYGAKVYKIALDAGLTWKLDFLSVTRK